MLQMKKNPCPLPELWGGIECTINRIGDGYSDQLLSTGHYSRPSDIDRLAELGIKTLRYPLLWERHEPSKDGNIDWTWADQQLGAIRRKGILPIAGLLHHGSGPVFTDLSSPDFPRYFARYAGRVARRYPWLDQYTPINEPLTTARFSGLYGIWFPHKKDPLSFVTMLLNQLKGIVLAMKTIREVNPAARLVQTEDLAMIHSTGKLSYQADFENLRRWLTFDLLCGKMETDHPLWDYLLSIGVKQEQLDFFSMNPCIPDICGVNYYLTSERYLDHHFENYPGSPRAGNGIHTYVDTEAVRAGRSSGLLSLVADTWQRYGLPMAITEAHLNCTREDQMRWLMEVWDVACNARNAGIDLRAVTAWSLLGANDWDSLLTRSDLHYESGAYEVQGRQLRLTAVGHIIRSLASKGRFDHPLLRQPGWWACGQQQMTGEQTLIITGSESTAATDALMASCASRRIPSQTLFSRDKNIFDQMIGNGIERYQAWGLLSVGANASEVKKLSSVCQQAGIPYMNRHIDPDFNERDIHNVIDLFIDHAVAYSSKIDNITNTYAKEPIHVCYGD
jgi:dTDP-4-dehydrorhamnose reductase